MNQAEKLQEQGDFRVPFSNTWGIFLISVLGLFLEMLLIRWIATEIRIFAYLQNTILVVCFLGLGMGCFTSRQPIYLQKMLFHLMLLVSLLAIPVTRNILANISQFLSVLGDLVIWNPIITEQPLKTFLFVNVGLFGTFSIMLVVVNIFIPIGRLLGRLMDEHPNTIWAYSVNVGGSLLGTWLFVMFSVFHLPPFAWFFAASLLIFFFLNKTSHNYKKCLFFIGGIIILSICCGWVPGSLEVIWSPYQKLVLREAEKREVGEYVVTVNNTGYQAMINLSSSHTQKHPDLFPEAFLGLSQYDLPLLLHPNPKNFLIVGAGTGNDVAGGLRHGIKNIVAVEIDPAIIELGRNYHPERPFFSPAVKLINDDARSFFSTCAEKFDIISFGLLDSHTTTAMTNARLDHYVYTKESITRAKCLLAEGGIIILSFEATKPFIADRMARVLEEVFNEKPLFFRIPTTNFGWGGVIFISGDLTTARKQISSNPKLATFIKKRQQAFPLSLNYSTKISSDDWPYIYLETPQIPTLYFLLAALIILLLVWSHYLGDVTGLLTRWKLPHWHFFFLGAAFLLLEVQNISKASVVLGNTWEVNAVIVSGVLAMILFANLISYKFPRLSLNVVYAVLIGICFALYSIDLASFAFLPYAIKAVLIGALTTLPMLFSGIIFIRSFAVISGKDAALGANLIGALVGALLQSVTFITGIKALLLIVAMLYLASLFTRPKSIALMSQQTSSDTSQIFSS